MFWRRDGVGYILVYGLLLYGCGFIVNVELECVIFDGNLIFMNLLG